jgi:hypothetical protein
MDPEMKLPDTLTVTAVDNETSRPVPNVAILLLLFAERKNDYDIGPFITNEMGQIKLGERGERGQPERRDFSFPLRAGFVMMRGVCRATNDVSRPESPATFPSGE